MLLSKGIAKKTGRAQRKREKERQPVIKKYWSRETVKQKSCHVTSENDVNFFTNIVTKNGYIVQQCVSRSRDNDDGTLDPPPS